MCILMLNQQQTVYNFSAVTMNPMCGCGFIWRAVIFRRKNQIARAIKCLTLRHHVNKFQKGRTSWQTGPQASYYEEEIITMYYNELYSIMVQELVEMKVQITFLA